MFPFPSELISVHQRLVFSRLKLMLSTVRQFLSLIRFSHTVFALLFALLAAAMAWRLPTWQWIDTATMPQLVGPQPAFGWKELLAILLCMATARSAAMAFNRLVDRRHAWTSLRYSARGEAGVSDVVRYVSQITAKRQRSMGTAGRDCSQGQVVGAPCCLYYGAVVHGRLQAEKAKPLEGNPRDGRGDDP